MTATAPSTATGTMAAPSYRPRVSAARVFLALLDRDLRVARRELPFFLIRTTMQPLLFVVVFGYLLPRMGFTRPGFQAALLPGILAVSLMFASSQSVTLPMVQEFGWTKEIEDRLLAPIPLPLVAIEKIVNAMIQGLIAALFVLPLARLVMGPIPGFTFTHVGALVVVVHLSATAASAFGLFLGVAISPQQIGFLFSLILTPMIFFGCAYYPWSGLAVVPWLQYLVLLNPLVYVSEGMRAALTPSAPHMPLAAVVAGLLVLTVLFTGLAINRFMKRALG